MEKFNFTLNINQRPYSTCSDIDIKSVVIILSDYFAKYGGQ